MAAVQGFWMNVRSWPYVRSEVVVRRRPTLWERINRRLFLGHKWVQLRGCDE